MIRISFPFCASIPLVFAGIITTSSTFSDTRKPYLFLLGLVLIAMMYAIERSFRLHFLLQLRGVSLRRNNLKDLAAMV